jgi:hypothetical protein
MVFTFVPVIAGESSIDDSPYLHGLRRQTVLFLWCLQTLAFSGIPLTFSLKVLPYGINLFLRCPAATNQFVPDIRVGQFG